MSTHVLHRFVVTGAAAATLATAAAVSAPVPALAATGVDFAVTMTGPAAVPAGEQFRYEIKVTNNSAQKGSTSVRDALPGNVALVQAQSTHGPCTFAARTVTCEVRSLRPGQTAELTIAVVDHVDERVTNSAVLAADDHTANDVASVTTTIGAGPALVTTKAAPFARASQHQFGTADAATGRLAVQVAPDCGGTSSALWHCSGYGAVADGFNLDGHPQRSGRVTVRVDVERATIKPAAPLAAIALRVDLQRDGEFVQCARNLVGPDTGYLPHPAGTVTIECAWPTALVGGHLSVGTYLLGHRNTYGTALDAVVRVTSMTVEP